MKRLIFEYSGRTWQYKVLDYKINEKGFYCFTDVIDGQYRELHESLFRGKEEVKQ